MKPGDNVVCITTHSQGVVKKGEFYTIRRVEPYPCDCGIDVQIVDVGATGIPMTIKCPCGKAYPHPDGKTYWLGARLFRKIIDYSLQEALEDIKQIDIAFPPDKE